jgi:AcrR family transcriptional regulator
MACGRCALSETRARVIDAALASLVRNGFSGTTARAIAQVGGFAPGVIYYHFTDLDDLLVAALASSSQARAQRYRSELSGVDKATAAVEVLRRLYREDTDVGHIAAVQEIYAGARPGSRLATQLTRETRRWEELAEELLTALLRGKPLAAAVSVRVAASAAVAFYLGMETLTHLDGDRSRPAQLFDQAARLAAVFDKIPRVRHRTQRTPDRAPGASATW